MKIAEGLPCSVFVSSTKLRRDKRTQRKAPHWWEGVWELRTDYLSSFFSSKILFSQSLFRVGGAVWDSHKGFCKSLQAEQLRFQELLWILNPILIPKSCLIPIFVNNYHPNKEGELL